MARTELTPRDIKCKKVIASRLQFLLKQSNKKQIDIHKSTGIPASTLTGYFKGETLPSPRNVKKLADFFSVNNSDIDPRFEVKTMSNKSVDLNDDSITFTYNGRRVSKEDMEIFKRFLRG